MHNNDLIKDTIYYLIFHQQTEKINRQCFHSRCHLLFIAKITENPILKTTFKKSSHIQRRFIPTKHRLLLCKVMQKKLK